MYGARAIESRITTPRVLSALELLLGGAIVIGHNVFHVVPNEVPILFVLALLSFFLRDGGLTATEAVSPASWSGSLLLVWRRLRSGLVALGFRRPASWTRLLLIALVAAGVRIFAGDYLIVPFAERWWPPPAAPEDVQDITGDAGTALFYLGIVWTFAAFGEEIGYRGYLLTRAADVGRRSTAAYLVAVVITAILFGYGHYYKGMSGVIDSGFAGLVLGAAYLAAGRNLWASILAHGFIDTVAVGLAFMGLDS